MHSTQVIGPPRMCLTLALNYFSSGVLKAMGFAPPTKIEGFISSFLTAIRLIKSVHPTRSNKPPTYEYRRILLVRKFVEFLTEIWIAKLLL